MAVEEEEIEEEVQDVCLNLFYDIESRRKKFVKGEWLMLQTEEYSVLQRR